jgi:hypothetical protein
VSHEEHIVKSVSRRKSHRIRLMRNTEGLFAFPKEPDSNAPSPPRRRLNIFSRKSVSLFGRKKDRLSSRFAISAIPVSEVLAQEQEQQEDGAEQHEVQEEIGTSEDDSPDTMAEDPSPTPSVHSMEIFPAIESMGSFGTLNSMASLGSQRCEFNRVPFSALRNLFDDDSNATGSDDESISTVDITVASYGYVLSHKGNTTYSPVCDVFGDALLRQHDLCPVER